MTNNKLKITHNIALILLAVITASLLNLCLAVLQARAAELPVAQKVSSGHFSDGVCQQTAASQTNQAISHPVAPMPACCLERGRNYDVALKTDNDKQTLILAFAVGAQPVNADLINLASHNFSNLTSPPPALAALASTIIRE